MSPDEVRAELYAIGQELREAARARERAQEKLARVAPEIRRVSGLSVAEAARIVGMDRSHFYRRYM